MILDGLSQVQVDIPSPPVVHGPVPSAPSVTVLPVGPSAGAQLAALTLTATAAVTLSGHRVVTPNSSGQLIYADPTSIGQVAAPLWVTTGAVSIGAQATVVTSGVLTEPSWSWSLGPIWVGPGGVLTQTMPTSGQVAFLAAVGAATSATSMLVARQPSIVIL